MRWFLIATFAALAWFAPVHPASDLGTSIDPDGFHAFRSRLAPVGPTTETGSCIDPNGHCASVSAPDGVRIDPNG